MDKGLNIKGLNIKHSFRIIAVLVMVFSFLTPSYAAPTGKGTKNDPYIIDEPSDLTNLRDEIQKNQGKYLYVKQTADIDLAELSGKAGRPPMPLSSFNWNRNALRLPATMTYFLGEYDGDGHTISNWTLPKEKMMKTIESETYYISMFGKVGVTNKDKSVIKNLNIDHFEIEMQATTVKNGVPLNPTGVSFLASVVENAEISNCHINNSKVYGAGHFQFGAIAANNAGSTITNCSVRDCEYTPTSGAQNVGAFCGSNSGDIKNCFAYNVTLTGDSYVGGLVGEQNGGTIENCGFNGTLIPSGEIDVVNSGGLCGKINKGSFLNCFTVFDNDGKTWKSAKVFGGLVGVVAEDAVINVKNCYAYPQIKVNDANRDNVDFFVGRDMYKEDETKRFYESCYCYENAYGEGFVPILMDGVDFSQEYKNTHKLLKAQDDFMHSGCFAEILRDYHIANLSGENQWREDVESQNDTLPVLRFMVDESYDVEPFCHPGIYTLSHSESGNVSTINGQLKFITDDQTVEGWIHGLEVKVGDGEWERLESVINKPDGYRINFHEDYTFDKKKTTVYRAFVYNPMDPARVAYGKIETICVGSSSGPETISGCDSLNYDGRWFFPKDNGNYTNSSNEEVIIKIGETVRNYLPLISGNCGANTVVIDGVDSVSYDHSGTYVDSFPNLTGCKTYNYRDVKLYPTLPAIDSLKVFSLNEKSYTYTPVGGGAPQTVEVGSEYVLEPKELYVDHIKYADKTTCDSATIVVKYVIPVKITKTEDSEWSCDTVIYNGVKYAKETTIEDIVETPDPSVPGGVLYEIRSHRIKAAVPDTVRATNVHCGSVIVYDCATGICESTEPFYDTTRVNSTISGCQCPSKVNITHHVLGEKPTREETIYSCGPYTYEYRGKKTVWDHSGDYTVTRRGNNINSCDNDTIVTYHVTIGEAVSYNDTIVHGCGRLAFKTLSGETKIFDKTQDFVDEYTTPEGCSSQRTVHVYIHKTSDKSSIIPVMGCAPYSFTKLNGDTIVFEAGNFTFNDTIKSKDGCGCDSIVKKTILNIEAPKTLDEIVRKGCNEVEIEGKKYTTDTSFVVEKVDPNIFKACRVQFQPYKVNISSSSVEYFNIDTCGVYYINGEPLTTSAIKEISIPNETGCDNKQIYHVRIIEPVEIDSFVYACENYVHKYYDGHQEMVVDDGTVLIDKIQSKVCLCDSIIRKVTVNISQDSREKLEPVNNCGPYTYVRKSDGKKILIESSQIVYDTLINRYGCHIYYETEVNIIPVEVTLDTLDACKEYHSELPVWNYNNLPVDVNLETPTALTTELIFLNANTLNPGCMDTTKLFLTVHGVGNITADPVVACDSFVYTDFDGTQRLVTSSSVIVDTLKSNVCDCDSVILTTNITINNSYPESLRKTNTLHACDTVTYTNSKGELMIFTDDVQYLDTFQMKNTGCDSVVIVDVTVPKSTGSVSILSACGDTSLYDELHDSIHFFNKSGVWKQILGENEAGCKNFIDWHVNIIPTPRDTIFEKGCGELTFRGDTYTSENENAKSFSLVVNGATKCDSIHNYMLTVYPKYNHSEVLESCDSVVRNGVVYKQTIMFRDTLLSRNDCDSVINVNITVHQSPDITDYVFGCNEVKFVDVDYNGGLPVYVHRDSTIYVDKLTENGCEYQLIQRIQVGHPSYSAVDVFECFDSENGYASYRDLKLTSDTIIYDTVSSENKCGTIVANMVNLVMPVHDTVYVDSCLHITYEGVSYKDSAEVIKLSKTAEMGCDSFTHVMLNVNKCFPYPVLVNKYNWILICNDVIFDDDKFKLKSNVKYKWYKDERLVSTTSESYFTEDKELDGCYQVGVIIDGGDEYLSDIVCVDENHEYTISPQPNPVDKLQPVTIICDFPVEGVVGTDVEVFNMKAEKVYVSKAKSNEIVIPGMTVSGYYLVRLTTVSGKVLTAKYVVK